MSVLVTGIFLVGLLNTSPIVRVQVLNKLPTVEDCQAVIERITLQEKDLPEEKHIAGKLRCLAIAFRTDSDADGPDSKVKEPIKEVPKPCTDSHGFQIKCKET